MLAVYEMLDDKGKKIFQQVRGLIGHCRYNLALCISCAEHTSTST
jgi:hypothetical protein